MEQNNYIRQVVASRALFLPWDQARMIRHYGLKSDGEFLYIFFVGSQYRICRKTGRVEREEAGAFSECLDFNAVMTIYDVLCREEKPCLSGEFLSVYALPGVVRSSGLGSSFFDSAAQFFNGHAENLKAACRALGGRQLGGSGDAAFQIDLFPFLPMQLRFWEGDEEFPAQLSLLWDKNTNQFLRYETIYYAAGHLLGRLRQLSGLE